MCPTSSQCTPRSYLMKCRQDRAPTRATKMNKPVFFFFFLTRPGLWWFRVSLFRVFQPVPAPHPVPPLFFFLSKYSLWRRCCDIVGHQRSGFNENLLLHAVLAPYHIIHAYRCFMWALSSMRICKGCAPDRTLWGHFTYLKGAGP